MPYGDEKSYGFFKMRYQGNPSAFPFKESPIHGCKPGDPGCGGNFKVKKKSKVLQALKRASGWVKSKVQSKVSDVKTSKKVRKTKFKTDDKMSWKTPRHL